VRPGIKGQLSGEGTLVRGPRFAAGDVGGKVRIFVQNARRFQPEQPRYHHEVTRVELAIEPVGTAKAAGKFAQPDAILDERQALRGPGLVTLRTLRLRVQGSATPLY
jgi:hypothetical protein